MSIERIARVRRTAALAVAVLCVVVLTSAGTGRGAVAAEPKARGPLVGLPSKKGAHIARIKALRDNSWLDLGKPAADPKWGVARGRSWTPKMVLDSKRQAAFYSGEGVHGFVKPDGHYQDDIWAYDVNAHRWICLYPGANTKTLKLKLDRNGLEVNEKGEQVPVAFLGHGYGNMTFVPELDLYMILFTADPYWKKAMPQRKGWLAGVKENWPPYNNPRHPIFYDIAKGKLTRKFVAGKGPGPQYFECILEYIPSRKRVFSFHRYQTVWFYDLKTNSWTLMKPKGKPGKNLRYDSVGCLDTKRSRVYIAKLGEFWYYDVKENSWASPNPKNAPRLGGGVNTTLTYDSVNDVIVACYYSRDNKKNGLYVYHPSTNSWEEKPFALKARPSPYQSSRSTFYNPELNAHFFYIAMDSRDDGVMRVWRYKRAVKKGKKR